MPKNISMKIKAHLSVLVFIVAKENVFLALNFYALLHDVKKSQQGPETGPCRLPFGDNSFAHHRRQWGRVRVMGSLLKKKSISPILLHIKNPGCPGLSDSLQVENVLHVIQAHWLPA
jgi:hypothetical protein